MPRSKAFCTGSKALEKANNDVAGDRRKQQNVGK
jgi:hypothetical protein